MKLLPTDAAYFAGLIDGEGCIFVNRTDTSISAKGCRRGYSYRSGITVSMTNLSMIRWIKKSAGCGQIAVLKRINRKHKQAWRWSAWSKEAATILQQLLPHLKLKKPQAKNLIAFQSLMRIAGYPGLSNSEWNRREEHRQISLRLNKRGS